MKSPVWSQVKKTSKGVAGKRVYIPLRHTLSESVGGLAANNYTLPTADRQQYTHSTIYQKRNYGRVKVDGLAIEASKGKGGWVEAFSAETQGIAQSFAIDIDQQVMGRGTGILGVIHSVSSSTVTVNDPHGITEATPGYMWFRAGMKIDTFDAAGSTAGDTTRYISSIDAANNYIYTDSTLTGNTDADDFIVRRDTGAFTSGDTTKDTHTYGNGVIMGIDRIIDDDQTNYPGDDIDSFQGIDGSSATNNWWRATLTDTARGILTETKIQEDLDSIEQNTDGDAPNLALTTYAIRNKLIEIVKSDRMISTLNLVGGWEAIKYKGGSVSLPIMVHKFCPTGYIYYLNLKYLKFYTLKKLVWDSSMGGVIKQVAGEDAFEAWFKMYGNLATDKRNSMGKGIGYTTS